MLGLVVGCGNDRAAAPDVSGQTDDPTSTTAGDGATTTTTVGRLADVDFHTFPYDEAAVGGPTGVEVVDVDYVDLDGDGEDEAAITVQRPGAGPSATDSDVLIYRATDAGPTYVTDVGWSDRDDNGIHDVAPSMGPDGERLVVQLFEPIDEDCCDLGVVERSFVLSGQRLTEVGDAARWPVVGLDGIGTEPIAVTFVPGSQRASIGGVLTNVPHPVTFDAVEGQVLSVRVRPVENGEPPFTVTIDGPEEIVGTVVSGETVDAGLDLAASGTYVITVTPDAPLGNGSPDAGQRFWLDFVLSD